MPKQAKSSPLKGKVKSGGVDPEKRLLLAKAIGPQKFEQKLGLDAHLKPNKEEFGECAVPNSKKKKSIQNLYNNWKGIDTCEEWLANGHLESIKQSKLQKSKLSGVEVKAPSNDFTNHRDNTCSSDSEIDSEPEEEHPPDYNKRKSEPTATTKSKRARINTETTNSPTTTMNAAVNANKIGDRVVVPLPLGRTLVIHWVDSNLSNLKVEISNDGLSVIAKTKLRHPKTATELLDHYDWGGENTNMAVSALDALLKSDESGLKPEPGAPEWSDPEVIVALDEPVLRTFVDIKGNETGHIGCRSDGKLQHFDSSKGDISGL